MSKPIEPGCLALVRRAPDHLFTDDDSAFKALIGTVVTVTSFYKLRLGKYRCWNIDSTVARQVSKQFFDGDACICPEEYLMRLDDPDISKHDEQAEGNRLTATEVRQRMLLKFSKSKNFQKLEASSVTETIGCGPCGERHSTAAYR